MPGWGGQDTFEEKRDFVMGNGVSFSVIGIVALVLVLQLIGLSFIPQGIGPTLICLPIEILVAWGWYRRHKAPADTGK